MASVITTVDEETIVYEVPIVDADGYALGTLRVIKMVEENWRQEVFRFMGVSAHLAGDKPPEGHENHG